MVVLSQNFFFISLLAKKMSKTQPFRVSQMAPFFRNTQKAVDLVLHTSLLGGQSRTEHPKAVAQPIFYPSYCHLLLEHVVALLLGLLAAWPRQGIWPQSGMESDEKPHPPHHGPSPPPTARLVAYTYPPSLSQPLKQNKINTKIRLWLAGYISFLFFSHNTVCSRGNWHCSLLVQWYVHVNQYMFIPQRRNF